MAMAETMLTLRQSQKSLDFRRKKEIQNIRTVRATVRDPSRKFNYHSRSFEVEEVQQISSGLSVPPE